MKKMLFLVSLLLIAFIMFVSCKKPSTTEYNIDQTSCNSCGNCIQKCPADAIEFTQNGKAEIDQTKCIQCGKCVVICPQEAIY